MPWGRCIEDILAAGMVPALVSLLSANNPDIQACALCALDQLLNVDTCRSQDAVSEAGTFMKLCLKSK